MRIYFLDIVDRIEHDHVEFNLIVYKNLEKLNTAKNMPLLKGDRREKIDVELE